MPVCVSIMDKVLERKAMRPSSFRCHLKNCYSAPGGVVRRLKMLTTPCVSRVFALNAFPETPFRWLPVFFKHTRLG